MGRLFNSTFENSLRLLILLDEYDMPKSLDMLYAVDFMTLYSASFGITDQNLNGDNDYKFSVFARVYRKRSRFWCSTALYKLSASMKA